MSTSVSGHLNFGILLSILKGRLLRPAVFVVSVIARWPCV